LDCAQEEHWQLLNRYPYLLIHVIKLHDFSTEKNTHTQTKRKKTPFLSLRKKKSKRIQGLLSYLFVQKHL